VSFLGPKIKKEKKMTIKYHRTQVILLHGYGSSGENIDDLGESLGLPTVDFWSPDAPEVCEDYPQGFQWFSLKGLNSGIKSIAAIWPQIQNKLKIAAKEYHIRIMKQLEECSGPVVLIGFSQGAMMAYELGFFGPQVKAVVGLSGAYYLNRAPLHRPKIFWTHAKDDTVLPLHWMQQSQKQFAIHGLQAEHHIDAYGGHSVTPEALKDLSEFLIKI